MPGRRGGNGERRNTLFWHDVEIFPPKMTKKGPRPRVRQSAPGGVETVIGTCDGVRWPPNPGWCQKIGAVRSLLLYRATYDGLGDGNATGQRGSNPGGHGPVGEALWRPRPGETTFRVPGASALRALSSKTANDRLSLSRKISFPAQSSVSRSKYRLAPVPHIRIPPILYFLFCYAGEMRWQW